MVNRKKKLVHIHSSEEVGGLPKLPTADQLYYGELAVNYLAGKETLSLRNSADKIVTFIPEDAILAKDEVITGLVTNNKKAIDALSEYMTGANAVKTLKGIPINKRLVIADLAAGDSFTLATTPPAGKEVHVIARNTSAAKLAISLPTTAPYVVTGKDAISLPVGGFCEINAVSDGNNVYIRSV